MDPVREGCPGLHPSAGTVRSPQGSMGSPCPQRLHPPPKPEQCPWALEPRGGSWGPVQGLEAPNRWSGKATHMGVPVQPPCLLSEGRGTLQSQDPCSVKGHGLR